MSIALVKLRGRVQSRLRDKDGRMDNPSSVDIDMALADSYIALQADLPAPTLYTANAFSITAGSDLFTLPVSVSGSGYGTGTVEYAGQVDIQDATLGSFLIRNTIDELNRWRDQQPTLQLQVPERFAIYEDNGQVIRGRAYPGAFTTRNYNTYTSMHADDLRDYVGSGSSGMDDVSANMSRLAAAALVSYTAAMLVARMTDDVLKLRGINPKVAEAWFMESDRLIYQEGARRNALESSGRTQQWVS